jgi:hypothetical protein
MLQKISAQVAACYERAGESRARAAAAANELSERITGLAEEVKRRLRVLIPPAPPHPAIPRPTCDSCGRKMRLTHIEPVLKNGRVANTSAFACKCGFTCRQVADR